MQFFKRIIGLALLSFCTVLTHAENLDTLVQKGAELLSEHKHLEAEAVFNEALALAEESGDLINQGRIYNNWGILFKRRANYEKSIEMYRKSLAVYYEVGNDTLTAQAEFNFGNALREIGAYGTALSHFEVARETAVELADLKLEAVVCSSLGNVNYYLNNFDLTEEYYLKALEIYQELQQEKSMASIWHNLSQLYIETDQLEKAEECLYRVKLIREKLGISLISNTALYGEFYIKEQNLDSAFHCFNHVLNERINQDDLSKLSPAYFHMASYYEANGQSDLYEAYLDTAYFWSDSLNQKALSHIILKAQMLHWMGNLESRVILNQFKKWLALDDSIHSQKTNLMNIAFKNDYEILKKNKELEMSETQLKLKDTENRSLNFKYQMVLVGLMIFLILVLVIFFLSLRVRKKNAKLMRQNETIQKLHSELNHRTKNYYQMFSGMLYDDLEGEEDEGVQDTLRRYLYRVNAMSQVQHHLVYSEDRLNQKFQLDVYLRQLIDEIDLALNHKEINVQIKCEFESVTLDYHRALYIGIALNELFQNAFKHSFHAISNPEINVNLVNKGAYYHLIVADNGAGMSANPAGKKRSKGLQLIADLMAKIQGEFHCTNEPENGIRTTLIFPV